MTMFASLVIFCFLFTFTTTEAAFWTNNPASHSSTWSKTTTVVPTQKHHLPLPPRVISFTPTPTTTTTTKTITSTRRFASSSSSTDTKPLYDGTNYTFPDTTKPSGIAELLEVSFVNACLQLRTGHVDVLKLFLASATAGYEFGFSLNDILDALEECKTQTAGRSLLKEEVKLRQLWISLVYLVLSTIKHPMKLKSTTTQTQQQQQQQEESITVSVSIPETIRNDYSAIIEEVANAYAGDHGVVLSLQELLALDEKVQVSSATTTDELERAVRSQSLRVISLTLQVQQEAAEAASEGSSKQPPPPPIEGAF